MPARVGRQASESSCGPRIMFVTRFTQYVTIMFVTRTIMFVTIMFVTRFTQRGLPRFGPRLAGVRPQLLHCRRLVAALAHAAVHHDAPARFQSSSGTGPGPAWLGGRANSTAARDTGRADLSLEVPRAGCGQQRRGPGPLFRVSELYIRCSALTAGGGSAAGIASHHDDREDYYPEFIPWGSRRSPGHSA